MEALDLIKKLKVVDFDWKDTNFHDIGFIAEEVNKILPEAFAVVKDVARRFTEHEE